MGTKIRWTKKAVLTFGKQITYLEEHWTEKEIRNFTMRVNEYLSILATQPLMARKSTRFDDTHIGLIIKQVSLVYRLRPDKDLIELIAFVDNRQNPSKQLF